MVGVSGTGNEFQIFDNLGNPPLTGLSAGTYVLGEFPNGTPVSLTIFDPNIFNCFLATPAITDTCTAADTSGGNFWGNFQAQSAGEDIYLTWSSLREADLSNWVIERSMDSLHFEVIRQEPMQGGAEGLKRYEVVDGSVEGDSVYFYRLCAVDQQGRRRFSPVRKIQMSLARVGTIGLMYPQPVQTQSQLPVVAAREGAQLDILIVDASGHVWAKYSESLEKGAQEVQFDWSKLPTGLYFLRAVIDEEEVSAQRILVWGN